MSQGTWAVDSTECPEGYIAFLYHICLTDHALHD